MDMGMVMGVVRALLAALGGYAVAKGWFDSATVNSLVGAGTVIATAVWSVYSKTPMPGVDSPKT